MARRAAVTRVPDSDDDVEMAQDPQSKTGSTAHNHTIDGDYPTPTSEEDSQNSQKIKLSSDSLKNIQRVSTEPWKLLALVNDLDALGTEQDLQIPKIVAIGDQSSGKSSVIAAISGITVPRKSGLCTRCPLHITLHADPTWKCKVSLERKYRLKQKNEWEMIATPSIVHFMDVFDLAQLEDVLFRAQAAILNPTADPREFASNSSVEPATHEIEFSPNLVRLDISGPDCSELTLTDLPGVFNQTSKKEHQHLPKQIKKLIMGYINNKNHILLLAYPMDADIENSSAGSMINPNADAKQRCIGLLTKPDRLPEGNSTESWKSILKGSSYPLNYGYFVTKQPSQQDLNDGVDCPQARRDEKEFFLTEPWSTDFAPFQKQFGTENLQIKLSDILVDRIRSNIPGLIQNVDLQLTQCTQQLSELPPPPKDSVVTVMRLLTQIDRRLSSVMQGELPHNKFIRKWMGFCDKLAQDVFEVRPTLVINSAEERNARNEAIEEFQRIVNSKPNAQHIVIEDDEDADGDAMPGQKRSGGSCTPSPSKRIRNHTMPKLSPAAQANKYSLDHVREIRMDKNTSAIGSVDHRADEYIITQAMKAWQDPLENFISTSEQALQEEIDDIVEQEFSNWKGTALYREFIEHATQWVFGASRRVQEFGERIVKSEAIKPMTINLETKQRHDQEETKNLREARRKYRANLFFDQQQVLTRKLIPPAEREKQMSKDGFDKTLGTDQWDKELEIMGRVRGYYTVASGSFVDTVCKVMRLDMFDRCKEYLIQTIEREFKLRESEWKESQDECDRLLAEDETRAKQRLFLEREKAKYEKAKKSLEAVIG